MARGKTSGMKRVAALGGLIGMLASAAVPAAAAGDAPLLADPYQIYGRTRDAWTAQRYPQYLSYTIAVRVNERGVEKIKHYHAIYDSGANKVHVAAVSDEEHANPPVPTGVTIHLLPKRQGRTLFDKRVGNPGEAVDYLGIPMLAPNYSFGLGTPFGVADSQGDDLVAQIRSEYHDPAPPQQAQQPAPGSPLKSIASVTAIAHTYRIQLAGIETIDGADCYHLTLQPARDPQRFRLRDVWVDTRTFETRRVLVGSNFTSSWVPWLITFAQVGNSQYIASEVAQAPVGVGDHRYQQAAIEFQDVTPVDHPSTFFDSFATSENVMTEPPF